VIGESVKLQQRIVRIVGAMILGIGGAIALATPASADVYPHPVVNMSGLCLDVPAFSRAAHEQLILWSCNGGANQTFLFEDAGGAWRYYIHPSHNRSMCLMPGDVTLPDSTIIQYPCDRGMSQTWLLGFGSIGRTLYNTYSGLCVGVNFSYVGAYVRQNSCDGVYRQWSLP
jgi:alpha-galactosidase